MKPEPKLTLLGLILMVLSFFVLLFQLGANHEFPINLVGMTLFIILGITFIIIDVKINKIDDDIGIPISIMAMLMLAIAGYMSYTDYSNNHFFDNHEIVECDKDISKCTYGVQAINPKNNFFFCATAKDGNSYLGDMELNPLKCSWRKK